MARTTAKAVRAARKVRAATDVQRVKTTGQFMTATLNGLLPGTAYTFRAYVETAQGTTYGEEQTFTTAAGATGVESAEADALPADGLQVAVRGSLSAGNACLKVAAGGEEAAWTLTALSGTAVAQGRVVADGTWQPLNASALPRGIYLLTVRSAGQMETVKMTAL